MGAGGVEGAEGLGELPEARILADTVFDQEPFECAAATGGEEDHGLVDAVEDGCTVTFDKRFAKGSAAVVGLLQNFEQVELRCFLFSRGRNLAFALAKKVLGTLGNNAIYIGLFGTVLGIIRAFHDISKSGSGGISIVINGIAEALVCTAAGLCVAVPAVIAYNYFVKKVDGFITDMELCASETMDLVKSKAK